MEIRSYRDPEFPDVIVRAEDQFLSDEAYADMVKKTIILCTDVVFTLADDRALYLAYRNVHPHPHPWVIGGRMYFNDETPTEAIVRCVKRETGMDIAQDRFHFLFPVLFSWTKVAQGDYGGKNLSLMFHSEITGEEKERIAAALIASEYLPGFGLQRFDRERLIQEKCHPVLIQIYDALYPQTS